MIRTINYGGVEINNKVILIIGGGGFIGSHLVDRFMNHNSVIVIDNYRMGNKLVNQYEGKIEIHNQDINNISNLKSILDDVDYIYYASAVVGVDEVWKNPLDVMYSDSIGLQRVLNNIQSPKSTELIYLSSSSVFGYERGVITENTTLKPNSPYNVSKIFSEYLIDSYNVQVGTSFKIIRLFNVYGERQDERMVIPRFINNCLNNEKIHIYGDGNQTRDFVYVEDAINAIELIAASKSKVFKVNVASGVETSINEIAEIVMGVTGIRNNISYTKSPSHRDAHEFRRRVANPQLLYDVYNYVCKTNIRDGIKRVYQSIVSNHS